MSKKLSDISKLIPFGNYRVHVQLDCINPTIERYTTGFNLDMNPDFQRGHVWTKKQQISFCEFILSGGEAPPILFNHPGWRDEYQGQMVLVDGLQRLTAIIKMLDGKLKVFGSYLREYEDMEVFCRKTNIQIYVNSLQTRKEVLKWYLELNGGGTPHSRKELKRVRELYEEENDHV